MKYIIHTLLKSDRTSRKKRVPHPPQTDNLPPIKNTHRATNANPVINLSDKANREYDSYAVKHKNNNK